MIPTGGGGRTGQHAEFFENGRPAKGSAECGSELHEHRWHQGVGGAGHEGGVLIPVPQFGKIVAGGVNGSSGGVLGSGESMFADASPF